MSDKDKREQQGLPEDSPAEGMRHPAEESAPPQATGQAEAPAPQDPAPAQDPPPQETAKPFELPEPLRRLLAAVQGGCMRAASAVGRRATATVALFRGDASLRLVSLLIAILLVMAVMPVEGFDLPEPTRTRPVQQAVPVVAKAEDDFASTGSFTLTGVKSLKQDEITEGLTFTPPATFEVEKKGDTATVRILEPRNVEYVAELQIGAPGEEGARTVSFKLNSPPLTVRIYNGRSTIYEDDAIQLVFSEPVDIYSLTENLQITPHSDYSLDLVGKDEVHILPERGWFEGETHHVKISANYTSENGKQFAQNQVLSVIVEHEVIPYVPQTPSTPSAPPPPRVTPHLDFVSDASLIIGSESDMAMIFDAGALPSEVPVLVETYRMGSLERYRTQGNIYQNYNVKLDPLEKLDTNAFLLTDGENRLDIPHFGEGAYLLSATYTDPFADREVEVRTSYMVTPISVYMQASAMETLIWLNSADQEAALGGYTVVFDEEEPKEKAATSTEYGDEEPIDDDEELPVDEGDGLPVELLAAEPQSFVTAADGTLVIPHTERFDYERSGQPSPFSVYDPAGNLVYYDNSGLNRGFNYHDRYYSTLLTDRTIYKPEDTVSFWGFVAPYRYNQNELPETATVTFDEGGLNIVQQVEISPSGVFHGEVELERIKSTQYTISTALEFPGETEEDTGTRHTLRTEYLTVKEFEKPTFILESSIDQALYGPNDEVSVSVKASFYDGSPLPFYPLEIFYHDQVSEGKVAIKGITTDGSGCATIKFPANAGGHSLNRHQTVVGGQYVVQIASDGEQVTSTGAYSYIPYDTLLDYSIERVAATDNLQMTVRAFGIDDAALGTYRASGAVPSYSRLLETARGEPKDVTVEMDLRWHYTDVLGIRRSNYYSFYNGYDNDHIPLGASFDYALNPEELTEDQQEIVEGWDQSIKRIRFTTTDGVAVIPDLLYHEKGLGADFQKELEFYAAIEYDDGRENHCSLSTHYYSSEDAAPEVDDEYVYDYGYDGFEELDRGDMTIPGYSFSVTNLATGEDYSPSEYIYTNISLDAGQQYRFDLLKDSQPVEGAQGRILYSVIQNGIYEHSVVGGTSFELPYRVAYGKNIRLVAAYFDGTKTTYIQNLDLYSTDESLKMNIDITPDKESYRPGEQVGLQVRATDYRGAGIAGDVVVAVVDESVFALSEQTLDTLYDLYYDIQNLDNSISKYCTSYREEPLRPGMMDGGKGGYGSVEFYDSYRSNFKDTAVFVPAVTDAAGNGYVSFTLPDNTTSWRITTVGVGRDLRAGDSRTNIISSLPFFCKPVLTSKYIEGDDISLLAQGHGTLLDEDSEITYTATLTGDNVNITLTGEAGSYQPLEFNFGQQPQGAYRVVVRAQYGGYSDTVELPISVLKSNLELVVNKKIDVQEQLDIEAVRYPVTLTLYAADNEAFMASINSLFGHYCMQANQRLSRFVSKRVIRRTAPDVIEMPSYIAEGNDYAADMQNYDGGIAFYPGDASDPMVTTYVLLVAGDQFDHNSMETYYRDELKTLTAQKTRAACYLGLAYLGKTDVDEITEVLGSKNLALDARAYLIAALAYLGEENATALYEEYLHGHIELLQGEVRQEADWERDAAAIWIAASRLGHADADKLSIYFGGPNWRYSTLFECMIYVTNYRKEVTPVSFNYTMKGQAYSVNLGLEGMKTLVLSKSDLENLRFTNATQNLAAVAYYMGEPEELGLEVSPNMSIAKSIEPLDDNTYEVTLQINLGKDAPEGQYDISDWVPSNTRLYNHDKSYTGAAGGATRFDVTEEGQKLYVAFSAKTAYATDKDGIREPVDQTILFKYRVRQTYQSTAALDTAYMIHGDSGENCNTEKGTFTPEPTGTFLPAITPAAG